MTAIKRQKAVLGRVGFIDVVSNSCTSICPSWPWSSSSRTPALCLPGCSRQPCHTGQVWRQCRLQERRNKQLLSRLNTRHKHHPGPSMCYQKNKKSHRRIFSSRTGYDFIINNKIANSLNICPSPRLLKEPSTGRRVKGHAGINPMNREITTPSTSKPGLTEQFALLELLLQEVADLARLFTLVKLLLNLLGPLLVQDLLFFGSLSNTKGVGKVNYIKLKILQ